MAHHKIADCKLVTAVSQNNLTDLRLKNSKLSDANWWMTPGQFHQGFVKQMQSHRKSFKKLTQVSSHEMIL
jgi:hypothetical protein